MKSFASVISLISNPLILSVLMAFLLVVRTTGNINYTLFWTVVSTMFASMVALFVFYGVRRGFFSDVDVSIRNERPKLFVFTAFVAFVYILVVLLFSGPKIIILSLSVLLLGILLDSILNTKVKTSIHVAVVTSFAFVLGILYGGKFWLALLLIPIVAWSRVELKRHAWPEVITGILLGISLVMIVSLGIEYVYE